MGIKLKLVAEGDALGLGDIVTEGLGFEAGGVVADGVGVGVTVEVGSGVGDTTGFGVGDIPPGTETAYLVVLPKNFASTKVTVSFSTFPL